MLIYQYLNKQVMIVSCKYPAKPRNGYLDNKLNCITCVGRTSHGTYANTHHLRYLLVRELFSVLPPTFHIDHHSFILYDCMFLIYFCFSPETKLLNLGLSFNVPKERNISYSFKTLLASVKAFCSQALALPQ